MDVGAPVKVNTGGKPVAAVFQGRSQCRGEDCGAPVLWMRTPEGAWLICDVPDDEDAAEAFEPHWATCPNRDQFRRRR